jgi:hypothetical protein
MTKQKIIEFETMARSMVGDGKSPNLFFVGIKGVILTISRDFTTAYRQWLELGTSQETSLEDRKTGTIATVQPKEDNSTILEIIDDSHYFKYR